MFTHGLSNYRQILAAIIVLSSLAFAVAVGGSRAAPSTPRNSLTVWLPYISQPGTLATAIDAGGVHTCVITTKGGLKCWGGNFNGQLGNGTTTQWAPWGQPTPVDVIGLDSGVSAIAAGQDYTCALTSRGGVKCWGQNVYGELGRGSTSDGTSELTPGDVLGLNTGVTAIAAGRGHSCALTTSGAVKCWGWNANGQLGNGTTDWSSNVPTDVVGLTSGVRAITPGGRHTCALMNSGTVKCWGENDEGQLGDGHSGDSRNTPVDVSGLTDVVAISAGDKHTCALTSSAMVKCWGANQYGQLGDGTTTRRLIPVNVMGLNNVSTVAAGAAHSCALINGGLKCWGNNYTGQLGNGTASGTNPNPSPTDVIGLSSGVDAVASGYGHTCALLKGHVKCWGNNFSGTLGNGVMGSSDPNPTPVDVIGFGGYYRLNFPVMVR